MAKKCQFKFYSQSGKECVYPPSIGSDFCIWHDPEVKKDEEFVRAGGIVTIVVHQGFAEHTVLYADPLVPVQNDLASRGLGRLAPLLQFVAPPGLHGVLSANRSTDTSPWACGAGPAFEPAQVMADPGQRS